MFISRLAKVKTTQNLPYIKRGWIEKWPPLPTCKAATSINPGSRINQASLLDPVSKYGGLPRRGQGFS